MKYSALSRLYYLQFGIIAGGFRRIWGALGYNAYCLLSEKICVNGKLYKRSCRCAKNRFENTTNSERREQRMNHEYTQNARDCVTEDFVWARYLFIIIH